jgi:hypothetical protein
MKKSILVIALILTGLIGTAQNTYNVILFSEDGEPFFAYVNGIRQNDKPETNVKVTGLTSDALSMRIQFDNKSLPTLKQNFMPEYGYEHTVKIKKNVKKVMKMQYFGKVALEDAPRTTAATVQYHTSENPMEQVQASEPVQPSVVVEETPNATIGNTNTSTTVTTVNTTGDPLNSNISINVGNGGISMNVNGMENVNHHSTTTTTVHTTSTISTTTVSTISSTVNPRHTNVSHTNAPATINSNTTVSSTTSSVIPRPKNPNAVTTPTMNTGCTVPMKDEDYEKLKNKIDDTPFADNKMSMAKAATKSNCLSVSQVKGICELMPMDEHRLTYAKYAYDRCTDKANYYQVSDAFSFPATTQKLNKFLEAK